MANTPTWDLEDVLVELGIGKYQFYVLTLLGLALGYSNISTLSFVFTAADLDYSCRIPECEDAKSEYRSPWMSSVTNNDNVLGRCYKYPLKFSVNNSTLNCTNDIFDTTAVPIACDSWIYSDEATSIVSSFNVTCNWEDLLIVGTLNNFGIIVGLPVMSYFADRYGRKFSLILTGLISGMLGILRSYATTYRWFLALEFFCSVFNSGVYPIAFILGMELVSSTKRPLTGMIIGNVYPVGAVMMGIVMWYLKDWRLMLRFMYIPGVMFIFYIWLIPESMRWLQTKGRHKEEALTLQRIAKVNKKKLPKHVAEFIVASRETSEKQIKHQSREDSTENNTGTSLKTALHSKQMIFRIIFCSYCWIAIFLVFYGLSLTSVTLPIGNKYANFIVSNLMEIPAAILTVPIMERTGRQTSQCVIFMITAVSCIACYFITDGMGWLLFILTMLSKLSVSILSAIIYIYTTEIFPTELRMSLHGLCSTFGRIGSMLAPQTPLLNIYLGDNATNLLFGLVSLFGAVVVLFLPETKDIVLPDTLKEAEYVNNEYHGIP